MCRFSPCSTAAFREGARRHPKTIGRCSPLWPTTSDSASRSSTGPMLKSAIGRWKNSWPSCSNRSRAHELLPAEIGLQRIRRLFETLRINASARARYQPRSYPGDVVVIRACEPTWPIARHDETLGWSAWVRGDIRCFPVPGDHHSVLRGAGAQALAEILGTSPDRDTAHRRS